MNSGQENDCNDLELTELQIAYRNLLTKYMELEELYSLLQVAYSSEVNTCNTTTMLNIKLQNRSFNKLKND